MDAAAPSTATSSAAVGAAPRYPPPPPPCDMPSWPCNHDGTISNPYIAYQEYLNSLVPPSSEELIQIAGVQAIKEAQNKRRYRVQRRVAEEASRQKYLHAPFQSCFNASAQVQYGEDITNITSSHSRDSSLLSIPNHTRPRSASTSSRSRSSSVGNSQHTKPLPIIQQHARHHGHNEPKPIDASTRWTQALRETQFRILTTPRSPTGLAPEILQSLPSGFKFDPKPNTLTGRTRTNPLTPRQRWKKAIAVACRAGFDCHPSDEPDLLDDYQSDLDYLSSDSDTPSTSTSSSTSKQKEKETQTKLQDAKARCREEAKTINDLYLLELVDSKHRYGLNLLVYHEKWKRTHETSENFFYWLDYGAGRELDLEVCSREKLNREQIRYLSQEEQKLYLVVIGSGGRLCWAKNGIPVDTSDRWRDSVEGIVGVGSAAPVYRPGASGESSRVVSSWSMGSMTACATSLGDGDDDAGEKIQASQHAISKELKRLKFGNSHASWLVDKLLRQQWGTTPWIFVADSSGRLYIGIKETGSFQHTSFVRGSRVAAAGMIAVKEGRLTSLSPLSGHYRPPTSNFRAFVKSLKEQGVNLEGAGGSRLLFGQDYLLLRGFEIYSGLRKVMGVGGGEWKGVGGGKGKKGKKSRKGEVVKRGALLVGGGGRGRTGGGVDTVVKEDVMIEGMVDVDYGSGGVGGGHDRMDSDVQSEAGGVDGAAQNNVVLQKLREMTSGHGLLDFGVKGEKEAEMDSTDKEKKEKKRKRKRKSIFSVKVKV